MVLPAAFAFIWLCVLGGSPLFLALQGTGLSDFMDAAGMQAVIFAFFQHVPLTNIFSIIFLFGIFIAAVAIPEQSHAAPGTSRGGIAVLKQFIYKGHRLCLLRLGPIHCPNRGNYKNPEHRSFQQN